MSQLSDRIYEVIEKSGLSYGDLSKMTGIPKSALQRYATGETKKIPIDRVELIAKCTNSSAKYILGWDEDGDTDAALTEEKPITERDELISEFNRLFSELTEEQKQFVIDAMKGLKGEK